MQNSTGDTFILECKAGKFEVQSLCPHRGGFLQHGIIDEEKARIQCPLHGASFDLNTGERLSGPLCGRIQSKKLS